MPAKRLPWFRVWMDATTHEKVRQLDDGQFRTWVELLDAASKQSVRGRFASRASAVALVRRPASHVAALIDARLIDEDDDKRLTMHDWDEWQRWRKEDANDYGSPPDQPPNDNGMSSYGHANSYGTSTDDPSRVAERAKKKETEVDTDTEKKTAPKGAMSESGETSPGDDRVDEVYEHFRGKVQPKSRLCPRKKIAARLKRFSVSELREGIDHFAADPWWMENNASRGAEWFFESDSRAEQFLLMKPRAPNVVTLNGPARKAIDAPPNVPADSPFLKYREVS